MNKHVLAPIKGDRHLKAFYELFLKPYIKTLHPTSNKSILRLIEDFFHAETRHLTNAIVAERFALPGGKYVLEERIIYGLARPVLNVGTLVTIRIDTTKPNLVEISFEENEEEVVYCLTQLQFQYILPKLREFKHESKK